MTRKTKYEVSYQRKRFFVSAKTDFSFCFGSFGVMLDTWLQLLFTSPYDEPDTYYSFDYDFPPECTVSRL